MSEVEFSRIVLVLLFSYVLIGYISYKLGQVDGYLEGKTEG